MEVKETPLHIAFHQKNNKSINLLLKYMSRLEYCNMSTFSDIWPQLVDFESFAFFMNGLVF